MAAASMASLGVTAALPAVSCSGASAVKLGSSANLVGTRLDTATAAAAAPSFSRSSRSLVVRAGKKPSFWDNITSAFGGAKKKVNEAAAQGEKELNKVASETKSASGDLGEKAEKFKGEAQAQAEEAAEEVKTGIEDLKGKVDEAVETAQAKSK